MSSNKQRRLKRSVTHITDEVSQLAHKLKETQKELAKHTRELNNISETFGDQVDIGIPAEIFIVTFNLQLKDEKRDESVIAGVFSNATKAKNYIKNDLSLDLVENFEEFYMQTLSDFSFDGLEDNRQDIKARAVTSRNNKVFIKCQRYEVE